MKPKNFSIDPTNQDLIQKGLTLLKEQDLDIMDSVNSNEANTGYILNFAESYAMSLYVRGPKPFIQKK